MGENNDVIIYALQYIHKYFLTTKMNICARIKKLTLNQSNGTIKLQTF